MRLSKARLDELVEEATTDAYGESEQAAGFYTMMENDLATPFTAIAGGISEGDLVEAAFQRGKIVITPKPVIDRSKFPNADDEHTPAQRRVINRGIAQSEKEYKQGRSLGPFSTHEEFIASLHRQAPKPRDKKIRRAAR